MRLRATALGAVCAAVVLAASAQTSSAPAYQYYRVGSKRDVQVDPHAGYALMGGGTDLDEAFRWLCDHADGGDFLVLRASGTDAYNPYIEKLCHLNSVATLIIASLSAANDPFVTKVIEKSAAIFISGGDQGNYIRDWAGTPVETALRDAVRRGIPIGGTSAGLAVMGQYIYSAENDKPAGPDLTSAVALANPFADQVVVAPDLLGIPILRGIITDTHFDTRDRQGRLLVFMARILESGRAKTIRGIGVDERVAVLVDPDGRARVVGKKDGKARFFESSAKPQQCVAGQPLSFGPVRMDAVRTGQSFDMGSWRARETGATLWVRTGRISSP